MSTVRQAWLIARREMRERARTRGFRISLLLTVLVVVAMVVLPGLLGDGDRTRDVGISGTTSEAFEQVLTSRGRSDGTTIHVQHFTSRSEGEQALRDDHLDLLVVDVRRLEWRGEADAQLQAVVTSAIQVSTVQSRAAAAGVDPGTLAELLAPVPVTSVRIGAVAGRGEDDEMAALAVTVALLMAIVVYGNLVLTGVVEEKSSRVVEVLLARVPAKALLAGKVVGIGLLGFAQLAVTVLAALAASMAVDSIDLPAVSGGVLAWVLVWFVLGYALYAMAYGALGSLASRSEDAQAVAGPVGYVLVAVYWASLLAIGANPGGLWARLLSLFPASAPLAMPGRIALGATSWWEAPAAAILTLGTIAALVGVAGRVYQNAILRTGAVVRLREAWRARQPGRTNPQVGPRTGAGQRVTTLLSSPHRAALWPIVLTTVGVLVAALVFTFTGDAFWSALALLLTFVAVRRIVQHR
ncbi:MAG TPA: ABC transporter permease [Marmoricola sp.]|nr:ABC transporter permease [Marmoricola sp.]